MKRLEQLAREVEASGFECVAMVYIRPGKDNEVMTAALVDAIRLGEVEREKKTKPGYGAEQMLLWLAGGIVEGYTTGLGESAEKTAERRTSLLSKVALKSMRLGVVDGWKTTSHTGSREVPE